MRRYQVVIEETVRYVVAVEADDVAEAHEAALEELINAESVDLYFICVNARAVVAAVKVEENGLPIGSEK